MNVITKNTLDREMEIKMNSVSDYQKRIQRIEKDKHFVFSIILL